jgi:hypothetical protein
MAFFEILVPILCVLVGTFVGSQCLIPAMLGTPWFPVFRPNWKVRKEIGKVEEAIQTRELQKKLAGLKQEISDDDTGKPAVPAERSNQ